MLLRYLGKHPGVPVTIALGSPVTIGAQLLQAKPWRSLQPLQASIHGTVFKSRPGATNFVNNAKVEADITLQHGDVIKFGEGDHYEYIIDMSGRVRPDRAIVNYPLSLVPHPHHLQIASVCAASDRLATMLAATTSEPEKPACILPKFPEEACDIDYNCAICFEQVVAPHSLAGCGHTFCGTCIHKWIKTKKSCPTCRNTSFNLPTYVKTLDEIMHSLPLADGHEERQQAWKEFEPTLKKRKRSADCNLVLVAQNRMDTIISAWSEALKLTPDADRTVAYARMERECDVCGRGIQLGEVVTSRAHVIGHARCLAWSPSASPPTGLETLRPVDARFCLFL